MEFPPPRNPDDLGRGPMVMGLTWTFTGLAIITTLLRLYVRKRLGPRLATDDWLMCGAMGFQIVGQAFVSVAFRYGMGKHQYDLWIPDQIVTMAMWEWIAVPPGLASGMLARASICILLIRLFGVHKWFRYYAIILTALGIVANILVAVCLFVSRQPAAFLWDPFIPNATQWDLRIVQDMMFLSQALYALADLSFVIIPVIIIWRLNMALSRRVGLIAVMGLSLFTCGMSIMKGVSAIPDQSGEDAAYEGVLSLLWATLEQACVILLGNVAPLRGLAKLEVASTISSSMASLLGRGSRSSSKPSAADDSKGYGKGGYYDIEMNTHKLGGTTNRVWHQAEGVHTEDSNGPTASVSEGQVRRTDDFNLAYAKSTSSLNPR